MKREKPVPVDRQAIEARLAQVLQKLGRDGDPGVRAPAPAPVQVQPANGAAAAAEPDAPAAAKVGGRKVLPRPRRQPATREQPAKGGHPDLAQELDLLRKRAAAGGVSPVVDAARVRRLPLARQIARIRELVALGDERREAAAFAGALDRVEVLIDSARVKYGADMSRRWRLLADLFDDPSLVETARRQFEVFNAAAVRNGWDGPNVTALVDPPMRRLAELSPAPRRPPALLAKADFDAPVLICGFPHSGTRVLAELLERTGVFQHAPSAAREWGYIKSLNTVAQPGWMDVDAIEAFDPQPASRVIDRQRLACRLAATGYAGDGPWGHKDPRTSVTASAWLRVFPQARIVNIVRNPLDTLGTLPPHYTRYTPGRRKPQLEAAFWARLWSAHLRSIRRSMQLAPRACEVRFEDLCADPAVVAAEISIRLGLPAPRGGDTWESLRIDGTKTNAHRAWIDRGDLSVSEAAVLERLAADHGYGPPP